MQNLKFHGLYNLLEMGQNYKIWEKKILNFNPHWNLVNDLCHMLHVENTRKYYMNFKIEEKYVKIVYVNFWSTKS